MNFSDIFSVTTMNIIAVVLILGAICVYMGFRSMRDGFQDMAVAVAGGAAMPTAGFSAPKDTCEMVKKQLDIYVDLVKTNETPIENIDTTISQMKQALSNYGCEKYFSLE